MNGFLANGVPILAGIACLTVAGILWFIAERTWPRLIAVLVLAGVTGIIGTAVGSWANSQINGFNNWISGMVGLWTGAGAGLGFVLGAVSLAIVVWDVVKGKVAQRTLIAAALLPILVTTIPGPIGQLGANATNAVAGGVAKGVGALFGA